MDRNRKIALIQRSLGIRHKLKVHESMKSPESHEEIALMLVSKWELEDELRAIEQILDEERLSNVTRKRTEILDKNKKVLDLEKKAATRKLRGDSTSAFELVNNPS
ncbi:hypothetical protein EBS43_06280 [bacterium]|jgi:hypothetical protein|nr:hypothetical protein [bacterium]